MISRRPLLRSRPLPAPSRDGSAIVVQIVEVTGAPPSVHDGRWVIAWNPHVDDFIGDVVTTDIKSLATVWPLNKAIEVYRTISRLAPRRPDGEVNRPLTAYSVIFEGAPR